MSIENKAVDRLHQEYGTVQEVATKHTCDFHYPPMGSIIEIRASQVLNAMHFDLGVTDEDLALWSTIKQAVVDAYRLGMKDGAVRLGDME